MGCTRGFVLCLIVLSLAGTAQSRKYRSVTNEKKPAAENAIEDHPASNSVDFIWSTQTVAAGDTAVLHCSFDAIFQQIRNGPMDYGESQQERKAKRSSNVVQIDWMKEEENKQLTAVASGKKVSLRDRRYRVYRPHHSALSVLIIRRAKKRDGGIFKCSLAGSSTRHKYLVLNVTESKIEAKTSPAKIKARVGKEITLWCNGTGYPHPVVYWTREDHNRRLPDGTFQVWGNGLHVDSVSEDVSGVYACYLDNFVQPVVSYKFSLTVEDHPWHIDGYKMRFDSSQWYSHQSAQPIPVMSKSFLLMCETKGSPRPLPKIIWYKDGHQIRNSRHFYVLEDRPSWRTSYTSSTLVIMRFTPRQQGNYTCVAHNSFRIKRKDFVINGYYVTTNSKDPTVVIPPDAEDDKDDFMNSFYDLQSLVSSNQDEADLQDPSVLKDDEDYAGVSSGDGGKDADSSEEEK